MLKIGYFRCHFVVPVTKWYFRFCFVLNFFVYLFSVLSLKSQNYCFKIIVSWYYNRFSNGAIYCTRPYNILLRFLNWLRNFKIF